MMLNKIQARMALPVLTCASLFATTTLAQPTGDLLPIVNPGFEANIVADNCFQGFIPAGWMLYDPNGIHDGGVDAVGGLHPEAGGPFFEEGAPEGDHVALVFLQGDIGSGPVGLTQQLDSVLEANVTYTLLVDVGNIDSGQGPPPCDIFGFFNLAGFPGYQVQLLAGGVVIAQDDNSLDGIIPEGAFMQSTVQVAVDTSHPQLGTPLEVRLINLNTPGTAQVPGIEVDFDNVRIIRGCPNTADIDQDGSIDGSDIAILVNVLTGLDLEPQHVSRSDMDCSGDQPNGADLATFIALLLN